MPKVLIVDDSLSVRRALERVLSAKDFEVVAARSGEEALERFAAVSPDLTIADVIMPGIGGFELCRKLLERDPHTPVILISGVGDAQIEQQARAVGAAAIIPKPFSPEDLSAALSAALNPQAEPQESEQRSSEQEPSEPEAAELQNTEPPKAALSETESLETKPSDTELRDTELSATDSPETEPPEAALVNADSDTESSDTDAPVPNAELHDTETPATAPNDVGLQGVEAQDADSQVVDLQASDPQAAEPQAASSENDNLQSNVKYNGPQADSQSIDRTISQTNGKSAGDAQPPVQADITASLNRFLDKPEVLAATLSDRQGVCLAHVGEYPTDAAALASYSRFLLVASDVLGTHYGADHTNGMVLEFPKYALYMGRIDAEHILSLHLSDAKALSVVRYLMNRTMPDLASELRERAA